MTDNGGHSFTEGSEVPLTEHNAEIRTIRAQWIGMKDENDNLMTQIEYLNKDAKESHDRIMNLEFQLKQRDETIKQLKEEIKHLRKRVG